MDREEHRLKAQQMWRKGYNQFEIAKVLGISRGQVSKDLKALRERYIREGMQQAHEAICSQIEHYRELRKELWEQWERSKQDRVKEVDESGESSKGLFSKHTRVKEGRLAESAYIQAIVKTMENEAKLLGLLGHEASAAEQGKWTVETWDAIERALESGAQLDVIEGRIRQLPNANGTPAIPHHPDGTSHSQIDSIAHTRSHNDTNQSDNSKEQDES